MLGDEGTGGGKVGKGSPRVLHNNTLAPREYFRMCGLLESEWERHHKSVTHPHLVLPDPEKTLAPVNGRGQKNKEENEGGKEGRKE